MANRIRRIIVRRGLTETEAREYVSENRGCLIARDPQAPDVQRQFMVVRHEYRR